MWCRCPNEEACKGDRSALQACSSTWPLTGSCAGTRTYQDMQCTPAYHGNLIGLCSEGYGTTKSFTCSKCMPKLTIIWLYLLAAAGMLVVMKVLCVMSLQPAESDDAHRRLHGLGPGHGCSQAGTSVLLRLPGMSRFSTSTAASGNSSSPNASTAPILPSQLLKPLVLFSQYLLIVYSLSIEWPSTLSYPFKALAWVWSPANSAETLNIQCLLNTNAKLPVSVQKLLFYLVLPVVMLLFLLALESTGAMLMALLKLELTFADQARKVRSKIVPTALVVLFFFYPSICRTTFNMFACKLIDQPVEAPYEAASVGRFWVLDMNHQCWVGHHRWLVLGLGLPLVFICCVAIPLAILLLTLRNKHRLTDQYFKQHYGFLYTSYKPSFCWWEAVVCL